MADFETGVGEGDVELAEAAAEARRHEETLVRFARKTGAEIRKSLGITADEGLVGLYDYLEGGTRLDESCETFAGLVRGMCEDEMLGRFTNLVKGEGVKKS